MPKSRCPVVNYESHYNAWFSVRDHFGPRPTGMSYDDRVSLYDTDMNEYSEWLSEWNTNHGSIVGGQDLQDTVQRFGKWMVWRCNVGTSYLGELPKRKREHVGMSCAPCPYDSKADPVRVNVMLGQVPVSTDHGVYYMKTANRGAVWGVECTYSGCPYLLENGTPYFYA